MLSSVIRFRPRVGSFEVALEAFRDARFQHCLAELSGQSSTDASLLRARSLLRVGRPSEALESLSAEEPHGSRDRGEVELLRSVASFRLGRVDEAEASMTDARVFGITSANVALEAEIEFYDAMSAFTRGAIEDARHACLRGLAISSAEATYDQSGGFVPLSHVVARIEEFLGLIAAAEGRYDVQLAHARTTLDILDTSSDGDVYQSAFALRNLAILARDFDLQPEALNVSKRAESLAWTTDISRVHFTTLEALGWATALSGDTVGSLRHFRRASTVATTDPERILLGANRAVIAREHAHRPLLIDETDAALELSANFDWEKAQGDERLYLLPLAQVAAGVAPARARKALDRYSAIRNAMDGTLAARSEARVRAEESYTHGIVLRAEGRVAASVERLRMAFETWASIGYEWRSACAALELAELDSGDVFRLAVHRELCRRPESFFAARARLVA